MVELQSLELQLANLKVILEDATVKNFSPETVVMVRRQIREVEQAIANRKIKIQK